MQKLKLYFANALIIFLFLLGTYFLFKSLYIFGSEYEYTEKSLIEIERFYTCKMLKYSDYVFYIKKRDEHLDKAIHHYNQAYMACWYCPRISDQDKARMCYTSTWAMLGTTPSLKIVLAVGSLLSQYGLECMKEWNFIKTNLYESQHHFEMYEFYNEILARA